MYLIIRVLDPCVELPALHDEVPVAGLDDAALGGDGPGRVDVVARHHPDGDARALALADGLGHLRPHGVLDAHHAEGGQVGDGLVLVVPVGLVLAVVDLEVMLVF